MIKPDTRFDPLQAIGCILGMVGASLIAFRLSVFAGYVHFLASSLLLAVWSLKWRLRWMLYMQITFTVINIIGLIHWSHP